MKTSKLHILEVNFVKVNTMDRDAPKLKVSKHPSLKGGVVLEVGDYCLTLSRNDLIKALEG